MSPKQQDWPVGELDGESVYACPRCRALVLDRKGHDDWHHDQHVQAVHMAAETLKGDLSLAGSASDG